LAREPLRLTPPAIVVHGGAGSWEGGDLEIALREVMRAAEAGLEAARTGSSVDMVVEAVAYMEDSGLFNAGLGSTLDFEGHVTMDAAVMRGRDLRAGGVAGVTYPRNPIKLARVVMERTPHVLLVGHWADALASRLGLAKHPGPSQRALERWRKLKESGGGGDRLYAEWLRMARGLGYDTVGAVAVDADGVTAAAVSTGGVTLKLPGRVGDSPIVGAGLYADARTAFSATGVGEYIISVGLSLRAAITYEAKSDIVAAVEEPLSLLTRLFGPGTAGLIGVSARGEAWASFNTKAMPWAALDSAGKRALMQDFKEA